MHKEMRPMFVIGPSHLHTDHTSALSKEQHAAFFPDTILEGHHGLPNWSERILHQLEHHHAQGHTLVWMVSDWKFNNLDYELLVHEPPTSTRRLPTLGCANNVQRHLMDTPHIECLGQHSLRILDETLERFPSCKLIFWCLYQRSRANVSSYPAHLQYEAMKARYASSILDLDPFTHPAEFSNMVKDPGGHPNQDGYHLLAALLRQTVLPNP